MGDALACAYGQMGKEKLRLDMAEGLIWVAESLRWRLDQLACGAITAFADDGGAITSFAFAWTLTQGATNDGSKIDVRGKYRKIDNF